MCLAAERRNRRMRKDRGRAVAAISSGTVSRAARYNWPSSSTTPCPAKNKRRMSSLSAFSKNVSNRRRIAMADSVFANVRAVLEASGARWEDLVDVTVYLTDMARDFKAYNAVWAEYFPDPAAAPCRTTLGITALPTPIAIELKCVARLQE